MRSSSKRLIAAVAALQILLYHCWIPVLRYGTFPGMAERFLIASTYSGVDVFFFLSAYSLVARPVENYGSFLLKRAAKLLPLFFLALLAGRFLWFLPSVMLLYLALPPLLRLCGKRPGPAFPLLLLGWAGLTWLILGVLRPRQDFGIVLFRIPSMILGAYAVHFGSFLRGKRALPAGLLLLAVGMLLVYRFGYLNRLNVPFRGTFYLTGIPVMLGTILLLDRFAPDDLSPFIARFGGMTLELYFAQMVFGTLLVGIFFRLTGSRLLTNVLTLAATLAAAAVIKPLNDWLSGRLTARLPKT